MIRIFTIATLLALCSCGMGFKANAPAGFAVYKDEPGDNTFKAVNADGVLYRVSEKEQKSGVSVEFWVEAIAMKMKRAGYKEIERLNVEAGGTRAGGFIFSAEQNEKEYYYMIVVAPARRSVVLIEASGKKSLFMNEKENILGAIRQVKLRQ